MPEGEQRRLKTQQLGRVVPQCVHHRRVVGKHIVASRALNMASRMAGVGWVTVRCESRAWGGPCGRVTNDRTMLVGGP